MNRRQQGGAAIYLLSAALLTLLLVGGLGLAESARASLVKTQATRALAAALQSAAHMDPQDHAAVERTFRRILAANLGAIPHSAQLAVLQAGGHDPLSGKEFRRPVLSARLEIPHRLEYLGNWLPEVRLRLVQTVFPVHRKVER